MTLGVHSRLHAIAAVEYATGVTMSEMCGKGRHQDLVEAKDVLTWLLHERCRMSYPEIAVFMARPVTSHSGFSDRKGRAPGRSAFPKVVAKFDELVGVKS